MTDDPQMIWEHGEPTGHTSWGPDPEPSSSMVTKLQARVEELEAELDDAPSVSQYTHLRRERDETRKQRDGYRARVTELEAELAKVKEQWEFAAKAQLERSEKAEAEVEKLQEEGKL